MLRVAVVFALAIPLFLLLALAVDFAWNFGRGAQWFQSMLAVIGLAAVVSAGAALGVRPRGSFIVGAALAVLSTGLYMFVWPRAAEFSDARHVVVKTFVVVVAFLAPFQIVSLIARKRGAT